MALEPPASSLLFRFPRSVSIKVLGVFVGVYLLLLLGFAGSHLYFQGSISSRTSTSALVFGVWSGAVVGFGFLLIRATVVRRLRSLLQLTNPFEESEPNPAFLDIDFDEFGQLALGLNRMREELLDHAQRSLESERYFYLMAESTSVALLVYNGDRISYANPAAEELTGYDSEVLTGTHGSDVLAATTLNEIRQFVQARLREFTLGRKTYVGEKGYFPARITTSTGTYRQVDLVAGVTILEGKPAILITLHDVSDRQEAEEARVAQRVAEQASKAKSEFLAHVSHELRTPLTSILGYTQLLQMDLLNSFQQDSLGRIERSSKHLLSLINEVLDFTKIEAERLDVAVVGFCLDSLLQECLEMFIPLADQKNIRLDIESQSKGMAFADPKRVKQIVVNLLSNAIRYAPSGSTVESSIAHASERSLCLKITNFGPPIAVEQRARLFQPFERLDTWEQGTGLGLSLSKRLAKVMGGELYLEKSDLTGTVFALVVPMVNPTNSRQEAKQQHSALLESNPQR